MSERARAGHRSLPHTADSRFRAWAPTVEECVAQAVLAMVESFVDPAGAAASDRRELRVEPGHPGDQVVAILDEVIYLMDTAGLVPVGVTATRDDSGALCLRLKMAGLSAVPQTGAVPKAVALHQLVFEPGPGGWTCEVTLDV